jgi:predicted component of type VI protein secretion system
MSSKYDQMGKNELRAACKAAGIAYGKLNNDGMRAALAAKDAELGIPETVGQTEAPVASEPAAPVVSEEKPAEEPAAAPVEQAPAEPTPAEQIEKTMNEAISLQARGLVGSVRGKTAGMKIEKDREERNGVKRPSAGGLCRQIWDALDAIKAGGETPTAKQVTELALAKGWNKNNASIEFYQWRKFNGIEGRAKKA